VLVAEPHNLRDVRLAATQAALDSNAPAVFEGGFQANGVYVGVDALVRGNDGLTLIEAKSSTSVKDEHIPDAAIQAWVLREAGVPATRVEVMHLNKDYRHPDQGDLFARTDVTEAVAAFLPTVPGKVDEFTNVLAGELPDHPVGAHCFEPRDDCGDPWCYLRAGGTMIEKRKLGQGDVNVGAIALGAMAFAGWYAGGDDEAGVRAIHRALDEGITLIDTAEAYGGGKSESLVGRAVRDRRDHAVVATKASRGSPAYLHEAIDRSLAQRRERRAQLVANPVQFDERPYEISGAPECGQNTEEVLLELGLGWDDLARLKSEKAIL